MLTARGAADAQICDSKQMEVIKKAVGIMPELFSDDTVLHLMTETSLVADLAHHLDKVK